MISASNTPLVGHTEFIQRHSKASFGDRSKTFGQILKALFSNSEQGFAYDINDLSTLYQDAAGTIPVTAAGQPVGLVLDKSKGLVLGGELVVNGDFSNGLTGWTPVVTAPGTVNIVNGMAELSAVGAGAIARLRNVLTVPAGAWYKVQVDVSGNTSASTVLQFGSAVGVADYGNFPLVVGRNTFYVYVAGASLNIQLYKGANNGVAYIDNVSIKSIAGNHAYQTVSASRPVLTNRVNLFNDSEVFSGWIRNDGVALTIPNPKYPNAVKLTRGASAAYIHRVAMTTTGTYTLTGLFKNVVGVVNAIFANNTAVPMTKVGVTVDGLDIYQATQTITAVPNSTVTGIVLYNANDSVEVYGLDVRVTQQSSTLPLYQKVVGSTQFEAVGFPNYLLFDGVDDFLQTNNIDFTATDKVSLFAGVRKLSDVNAAILCELSADINSNNGSFYLAAPLNAATKGFALNAKGTITGAAVTTSNNIAPASAVLTGFADLRSTQLKLRLSGIATTAEASLGVGNYGNYPLYIGRRGGTSIPFNGHLYSLVGVGRLTNDYETTTIEKSIAKNVGVTL